MGLDALDLAFRIEKQFGIKISQTESYAVLFHTAGHIHRFVVAKLRGEYHQTPHIEPLYRDINKAVNGITGWWRLSSSMDLNRRFRPASRAENWRALEVALGVSLPPLDQSETEPFQSIPKQCSSIIALAYWIAEHHPEQVEWLPVSNILEAPPRRWDEEEVWRVLRKCISDALGVKLSKVIYDARMVEDLGMC